MSYTDEEMATSLLGPATKAATRAMSSGIYLARSKDQRMNSVHLLYGLCWPSGGVEETVASTILCLRGYELSKVRESIVLSNAQESEFINGVGSEVISDDLCVVLEEAQGLARGSRYASVDTAHLLLAILQSNSKADDFLGKMKRDSALQHELHLATRRRYD